MHHFRKYKTRSNFTTSYRVMITLPYFHIKQGTSWSCPLSLFICTFVYDIIDRRYPPVWNKKITDTIMSGAGRSWFSHNPHCCLDFFQNGQIIMYKPLFGSDRYLMSCVVTTFRGLVQSTGEICQFCPLMNNCDW